MANQVNYADTYWSHKGKHEQLNAELEKLIPSSGEVAHPDDNPALERFRIASNCYYDLYNNGLGNRAKEFRRAFGFSGRKLQTSESSLTQELVDRTEAVMDAIIIAAAKEQNIGESALAHNTPHVSPTIAERIWPTINRRRGELINKKYDIATDWCSDEEEELEALQEFADIYLAPFDKARIAQLEALLQAGTTQAGQ